MFAFLKKYDTIQEKAFLAIAIIALCQNTLFIYPIAAISHIGLFSGLSKLILPGTYLFLFLIAIHGLTITRNVRIRDFLFLLFFATYIIISSSLSIEQSTAISEALTPEILPCLPFFFIGLCLKIDKVSFDALGKWSCLAVILTSFYRIFYQNPEEIWDYSYNMGAAYNLLANILIVIVYSFYTRKKTVPVICILIGMLYLLGMGTRGPFLTMLCLLVLCFCLYSKLQLWKKVLIGIILGVTGLLLSLSTLLGHFGWLNNILSSFGLSTRILDIAIDNEMISNSSGRDDIFLFLTNQMDNMPFLGYGVLGESRFDILYAHNIYLQIVFEFGYFIGALILAFLVIIATKSFFKTNGTITQKWVLIWIIYVFFTGIFGCTFFSFPVFMLIGSCLMILRTKKEEIQ